MNDTTHHWAGYPLAPTRLEAHYGDRVVRCFTERPRSFAAMLTHSVAANGTGEALVFEGRRWTYTALDNEVGRVAAGLAAGGLVRGERVVLWMGNVPEFVIALYAVQRLGAIAVPVSVREATPGMEYILNQCGAVTVIVAADLQERLPSRNQTPALRSVIATGAPFDALRTHGTLKDDALVEEEDTALILYTSGTTGRPKGAMLTHLGIVHSSMHFAACMRLTMRDRSALAVPVSHVTGVIAILSTMLCVGGAVLLLREFKAAHYIAQVAAERVTHTIIVPAMYNLILLQPELVQYDLSAWRVGGFGGAPMPVATIDALTQRLPNMVLTNAYGATEATSPATCMPAGETRAHSDTVGVTVPCGDIRIMDDQGREVPRGETGELWIAGPMMVKGYWDNPEATAREFTSGWWHSGDLGSMDEAGYVRIFDRKKDMLNRGGFKIYSIEVENALMALPGVIEAAVIGKPCPVLGERVHAILYAPNSTITLADIRAYCTAQLADYKVPESVDFASAPLPRNANGKVMKRQLRLPADNLSA